MKTLLVLIASFVLSNSALAGSTKTVTGERAKIIYQAIVQGGVDNNDNGTVSTVHMAGVSCSITMGAAYTDGISRGYCGGVIGDAAAVSLAYGLIAVGASAHGDGVSVRPSVDTIDCQAGALGLANQSGVQYSCDVSFSSSSRL